MPSLWTDLWEWTAWDLTTSSRGYGLGILSCLGGIAACGVKSTMWFSFELFNYGHGGGVLRGVGYALAVCLSLLLLPVMHWSIWLHVFGVPFERAARHANESSALAPPPHPTPAPTPGRWIDAALVFLTLWYGIGMAAAFCASSLGVSFLGLWSSLDAVNPLAGLLLDVCILVIAVATSEPVRRRCYEATVFAHLLWPAVQRVWSRTVEPLPPQGGASSPTPARVTSGSVVVNPLHAALTRRREAASPAVAAGAWRSGAARPAGVATAAIVPSSTATSAVVAAADALVVGSTSSLGLPKPDIEHYQHFVLIGAVGARVPRGRLAMMASPAGPPVPQRAAFGSPPSPPYTTRSSAGRQWGTRRGRSGHGSFFGARGRPRWASQGFLRPSRPRRTIASSHESPTRSRRCGRRVTQHIG